MHYYRATKKINKTALLEFLEKETLRDKNITIELREVLDIIYLFTSKNKLLEKVDELYPSVFEISESPLLEGKILFSNSEAH